MIEVGDKVRTHERWNDHRAPIEGIVIASVTEKYTKTKAVQLPNGLTFQRFVPGQYEYTDLIVLDNGIKIHESNLEKVE